MAIAPMFRSPSRSILDFAEERSREAANLGDVITNLARPVIGAAQPTPPVPMPVDFNPRSTELLGAADPRLRDILTETERRAREQGIEIQVSETLRDPERQRKLVEEGKSQTLNSMHLTGNAADIYVVGPDGKPNWDFNAYGPVADIAKEVAAERGYDDFVWGGDWKTLKDGVHFQVGGAIGASGGTNTMMGGAGADTLGGSSVEGILASLYPQPTEDDARRDRRRDILAGVGQVFSALDVGAAPDVSNIRASQEARRRQAVMDMRERERSRAAASLVASQGGSPDMVSAVVTGAISYNDFASERERKRIESEADLQRLRAENQAGRLADLVGSAWNTLGLPDSMKDQVLASIAAGDDPETVFTLQERARVAEAAREQEEAVAESAAQRSAAVEAFSTSQDPVEQMAGRFLALDPTMTLETATKLAADRLKTTAEEGFTLAPGQVRVGAGGEQIAAVPSAATPSQESFTLAPGQVRFGPNGEQIAAVPSVATAAGDVPDIEKAKSLFEGGAINPATNQPFTSQAEALAQILFYKAPTAANGGMTMQWTPDGGFTITQAPTGGAAAGGVVDVAKAAPGTSTVVQNGTLTAVPIVGSPEYAAQMTELAAEEQQLRQSLATETSVVKRSAAEARLAEIATQKAAALAPIETATAETALAAAEQELQQRIANAGNETDRKRAEAELANLQAQRAEVDLEVARSTQGADVELALANAEKARADAAKIDLEVAALERDEAAKKSAEYENAMRQFGVMEEASQAVLDSVFSNWATGPVAGVGSTIGRVIDTPTVRRTMLQNARQLGSQAMLNALVEAKAAGVTMTPVSNLDVSALGASETALSAPEELQDDAIAEAVVQYYNYTKDQLFGPKDLTRLDQYGNEYQVSANTLGVSEDTFARHWAQIPPDVAEAWRTGQLPMFPTDNPAYAEAADVLNAMTTNWELYQGDLDRAAVGAPEEPAAPVAADTDLPPPPDNVAEDEWPEVWQFMSEEARAEYRARTGGQ